MDKTSAQKIVEIGEMILNFAKVDRITMFKDKSTFESDTDHTVMLSVIACSIASRFRKDLDVGLIAELSIVHDLVEAYAGDTPHIGGILSEDEKHEKERKEKEALQKIKSNFGSTFPWIHETILKYESLESSEAKFIKTLDKIMPKITHYLNDGVALRNAGYDAVSAKQMLQEQEDRIRNSYGRGNRELMELFRLLSEMTIEKMKGSENN